MKSIQNNVKGLRAVVGKSRFQARKGNILVLAAAGLIMVFGFLAFTVDVGFMAVTKTQMQGATDGAALASGQELIYGWGPGAEYDAAEMLSMARGAAAQVAAANPSGERDGCYVDGARDVRFGHRQWDPMTGTYHETWGAAPDGMYNLVEVVVRRDQPNGVNGGGGTAPTDAPVPLFFGPVIGHENFEVSTTAVAAFQAGVGFRIKPGSSQTAKVLPITLDDMTWHNLIDHGIGQDNYHYNPDTGEVTSGSDGILEVNLYPEANVDLPPGNRGTVDLGSPNNSTNDLKRQILYGLNDYDLSFFPNNEIRTDLGPIDINGDTGLSAGIKAQLATIIGETRAIPIFTSVSGPGNNANYVVTKFVGIRILDVKLTGPPNKKHLTIQPAPFYDETVIPGDEVLRKDSIVAPLRLIR